MLMIAVIEMFLSWLQLLIYYLNLINQVVVVKVVLLLIVAVVDHF
jgi:hypothetical protein